MRAPISWLRDRVALPEDLTGRDLAEVFTGAGLQVETVETIGDGVGPLVVGRVVDFVDQPQKNGKLIRWCHVDVGPAQAPDVPPAPVEDIRCPPACAASSAARTTSRSVTWWSSGCPAPCWRVASR